MKNSVNTMGISAPTMPFEVDTEWIVVTGAPSSGKSTVLRYLAEHGYETKSEVARVYLESNVASNPNIRSDESVFQRKIIEKKLNLEKSLDVNKQIFLDRGMPDSVTYYRVAGLDPNEAANDCCHFRYKRVFLFERLPFHDDGIRNEGDDTSDFIQLWLEKDYRALGYEILSVPVMSIESRAEFMVNRLSGRYFNRG